MTALDATALALPHRLRPTDLALERGQIVALIGPNGGGKTSLLRALARVEEASVNVRIDGELLDDQNVSRRCQLISFLPASREMAWPIVARDIIALGLPKRDETRIAELIDLFELADLAERPIDRLSTGERSRVLLARALAARPKVVMLDEPLAHLEPYWVLRLTAIMRDVANDGTLILTALHDLHLIDRFDRALLIAEGQLQMNETPADLVASERFGEIFRITAASGGWAIRPVDRRSSR